MNLAETVETLYLSANVYQLLAVGNWLLYFTWVLCTLWSLLTAGCNLATSNSVALTAFLTSNFVCSAAFITPGVCNVAMSVLTYYLICDSPSEIVLEEFTQRTTMKSRAEIKTVENRKDCIATMLHSSFL